MVTRQIMLTNASGLHARPASDFVNTAARYISRVTVRRAGENTECNAKSIMMVLAAGFNHGQQIEISAEGPDEEAAVDALVTLIQGGFGE